MSYHEHGPVDPNSDQGVRRPFLSTPAGFALCVFLAVAGMVLWVEHRLHILGALPLLLPLLICIGMHFFMHRGHGGHGGRNGGRDER
jgi:fatty acid desaturase